MWDHRDHHEESKQKSARRERNVSERGEFGYGLNLFVTSDDDTTQSDPFSDMEFVTTSREGVITPGPVSDETDTQDLSFMNGSDDSNNTSSPLNESECQSDESEHEM